MAQHQKEGRATDGGQYIYVFNLEGEPLCKYTLDRYITGFHVDEKIRLLQRQMLIMTSPLWSSALVKVKCNRFEKERVKPTCR